MPDGTAAPDVRVWANTIAGETALKLRISFPATLWGRAGLHTGDRLESWNGVAIGDQTQFRDALGRLRVGDTVRVAVRRNAEHLVRTIILTGYDRPVVKVDGRADATDAQRAQFTRWLAGR